MKSIFMWDEYKKEYSVERNSYSKRYYMGVKLGELIKTNKIEIDLSKPELNIDESIYLEDRDIYLTINNKARTDKDNILYMCNYILVEQENDKELRASIEQKIKEREQRNLEMNKLDIKEEQNNTVEPKSFLDKLKFWR